jgi:YD repeat-containing protein
LNYLNNRLISETNPIGITTLYGYNGVGQRVSKTDGNGVATTFEYYPNGKLWKVSYTDSSFKEYRYDERGRKIYEANESAVLLYAYDDLNRMISYTQSIVGGISKSILCLAKINSGTYSKRSAEVFQRIRWEE